MHHRDIRLKEAIQEIDNGSWLIAGKLLLSRQSQPPAHQPSWSDGNGSFFTISKGPHPLPDSIPLPNANNLQNVYDAGGVSSVWRAGEAFIKIKKITQPKATREHVTLRHVRDNGPHDFDIPQVHYYDEFDGLYCIVLGRIPGPTLAETWPTLSENAKQDYARRIAAVCNTLAQWQGSNISGLDGCHLADLFLTKRKAANDCSPQHILGNCKELGMDTTPLGFYHCDLGPGNIIVTAHSVGIIDWETAGFVPREWVRTKFCVSTGLDLPVEDETARYDWRIRVSRELQHLGFKEIAHKWMEWWDSL